MELIGVKHLNEITVINELFSGYWMNPAYRVPEANSIDLSPLK